MTNRLLVVVKLSVVVAVLGFAVASLVAQSKELGPFAGTWRANIAKSKYNPGPPPKAPGTLRWEPTPSGFLFTVEGFHSEGQPLRTVAKAAFDGREYPLEGPAQKTMRVYRRIDERTFEEADSVAGKPTITRRIAVAPDGKTLTITVKGTNAQGQTVNNVVVYEKQ